MCGTNILGELIGFVDLGDIHTNFATLDDVKELATHVLVFLVKSIVNSLSYSLATFATTGVKSFQIMPIFGKLYYILRNVVKKLFLVLQMVPRPIEIFLECIKHWNVRLGKLLFIELRTFTLKKIALFISFVMFHI